MSGEIGIFICDSCNSEGGWYEQHVIDGTPIELSEWVECCDCRGNPEARVLRRSIRGADKRLWDRIEAGTLKIGYLRG